MESGTECIAMYDDPPDILDWADLSGSTSESFRHPRMELPLQLARAYLYHMPSEPKYEMSILCLANSRRPGGSCVAGKEFVGGKTRAWVRPVSRRNTHEISALEQRYKDEQSLALLDIVSIPMIEPRPMGHQTENHVIAGGHSWTKKAQATWPQITAATDKVSNPLWHDGENSFHGRNDKVPEAVAKTLTGSLLLIAPDKLNLVVASESKYGGGEERKVRADFHLNGVRYNFVVTDPWIEAKYLAGKDGVYPIKDSRLCISLAEVINGIATKLVAAVITPDRVG